MTTNKGNENTKPSLEHPRGTNIGDSRKRLARELGRQVAEDLRHDGHQVLYDPKTGTYEVTHRSELPDST